MQLDEINSPVSLPPFSDGEYEEEDYPTTIDEVVEDLPVLGKWSNSESAQSFKDAGNTLLKDYEIDFEEVKDILELLYEAARDEFKSR
jgi:hypothetical protein